MNKRETDGKQKEKNTDEVENITDNTENGKEQNGGNEQQLMHEKPLQPEEENDTDKKYSGQEVPTLKETLEVLTKNKRMMLGVEIKEYTFETVDLTVELLNRFDCLERCFFYCFHGGIIKYLKQKYNVTTMGYPDFKMKHFEPDTYSYYDEIGIGMDIMTQELCGKFTEMGFPLHIYCADNEEAVLKAIGCGASLITANDPVPLIRILEEKGMRI
jgi:glycerophosphoryl diester phosphodiesterase